MRGMTKKMLTRQTCITHNLDWTANTYKFLVQPCHMCITQTRITKIAKITKKTSCADALHKHASAALGNFVLPKMWCCKQSCKQTVQHTKGTAVATVLKLHTNNAETKLTATLCHHAAFRSVPQRATASLTADLSALCFFRSDSSCFFKTKSSLIADSNLGILFSTASIAPP